MHWYVLANFASLLFFIQEEIEIEAKVLRVGKAVAVVSVELRKKDTGKIVAQGRHTKYLAISSKMWIFCNFFLYLNIWDCLPFLIPYLNK